MYCLSKFCRLCMNADGPLVTLFSFDSDMITFYHKLEMCLPEVIYDGEINKRNLICESCAKNITRTYDFRKVCLKTDTIYKGYVSQLSSSFVKQNTELIVVIKKLDLVSKNPGLNSSDELVTDKMPCIADVSNNKKAEVECKTVECISISNKSGYPEDTIESIFHGATTERECRENNVDRECSISYKIENNIHISNEVNNSEEMKIEIVEWSSDQYLTCKNGEVSNPKYYNSGIDSTHSDKINMEKNNTNQITYSEDKPYVCHVCFKGFCESYNLKIHMRRHTGEKPYTCDICCKSFRHSNYLTNHKRTHTGEKPYICKLCNKGFCIRSNLNAHKRAHTRETPYECDVCNKPYSYLSSLNYHKQTHSGIKPYMCDVCNKTFINASALRAHTKTHEAKTMFV